MKTNVSTLKQIVRETQSGINILGQTVLELLIKTIFCMFSSITQELLGLLKS